MDLSRQHGLVLETLRDIPQIVVGSGTTGSWTVHALLRHGFKDVRVFDFDLVEPHNLPAQLLSPPQVNERLHKVNALKRITEAMGLVEGLKTFPRRTEAADYPEGSIIWSCVDEVEPRIEIGEFAQQRGAKRLIDMRMGKEEGNTYFVGPMQWDAYFATLKGIKFEEEPACGKRAMLTTGQALVTNTMARWFSAERGDVPLPNGIYWSFRSGETYDMRD